MLFVQNFICLFEFIIHKYLICQTVRIFFIIIWWNKRGFFKAGFDSGECLFDSIDD